MVCNTEGFEGDTMKTTEFKIGDRVTFRPYGKAIPAKVVKIVPSNKVGWVKDDDRIFYKLTGADNKHALTTTTTGGSIMESSLYASMEDQVLQRVEELISKKKTINRICGQTGNLYAKAEGRKQASDLQIKADRLCMAYNVYTKKLGTIEDQQDALELISMAI
jgi:hypothetical protein